MAALSPGPITALVVAGGRGVRAGSGTPKQYRRLGGATILARSARPFLDHPSVGQVTVVIHPDDRERYAETIEPHPKLNPPVEGGRERQESVRLGLEALSERPPEWVLIHDGARPFVTLAIIDRVIAALAENPAVMTAVPTADTLKRAGPDRNVEATLSRDGLYAAQTPQGFKFAAILEAHRQAASDTAAFTDDAAIAEHAGLPVRIVEGDAGNTKITNLEDLKMAERFLAAGSETRVGTGYDVHALGPGTNIMLGGIRIPHDQALIGHSDADVVLHALTDAILGAIGEGDIGTHFPPSDSSLAGANSGRFLAAAVSRLQTRDGAVVHLDVTIIAEAPKIGPHREAMRHRIAEISGIDVDRVAVKATTNERLGFIGRGEGIAALATATIRLPSVP